MAYLSNKEIKAKGIKNCPVCDSVPRVEVYEEFDRGSSETNTCMTISCCIVKAEDLLTWNYRPRESMIIKEAVKATRVSFNEGGSRWLCRVEDLKEYAKKLLEG